jgi:hypothetical protein
MIVKPRYTLRTVLVMTNEITQSDQSAVEEYLRKTSTGAALGNLDASDMKPPRLKVLAGMSPEIIDGVPGAQVGKFWITLLAQNLGDSVTGSLILPRRTYQVWAPRGAGMDQKGPLATSSDGIHWDQPDQEFEVRFPMNPKVYKWKIGKLVTDYKADLFGSQQPENKSSKPIATKTYDMLWLIDLPDGRKQLCIFTASRTGVTPTTTFAATLKTHDVDHYYQRYQITTKKFSGPTGDPYFSFEYRFLGKITSIAEAQFNRALYEQYVKTGFAADMDEEEVKPARAETGPRDFAPLEDEIPFA